MGKLTMREYTSAFLIVPIVLGLVLNFSGGVFSGTDAQIDDKEIDDIKQDFEDTQPDVNRDEVDSIGIQTDFFFLSEIWNVITGVVSSAGQLTGLFSSVLGQFPVPSEIIMLSTVVVAGVVWEVVSLARGMRT
jgi:hypothetical protein